MRSGLIAIGVLTLVLASCATISAVTMVLAMPAIGRLLDRLPTERMSAAGLLVMAATLASATLIEGFLSALAYALVFGINNAANMTFFGYMWPRYFGRRHLGSIQGTGQMIAVIGASLGPLPFGLVYDLFGSYNHALLGAALLPLACAMAGCSCGSR